MERGKEKRKKYDGDKEEADMDILPWRHSLSITTQKKKIYYK
jgi:hypothetical protein